MVAVECLVEGVGGVECVDHLTRGIVITTKRRAARPSGRSSCGAGAGSSAIKYQSLCIDHLQVAFQRRARKVDIRLPGSGSSNSHGAGPVY